MKNQSLHLIKNICVQQKLILALEQNQYDIGSQIKEHLQTINHLVDELIQQVQIDCNEEDLNNEIKETLITGGKHD
jgi:hypothetical protein